MISEEEKLAVVKMFCAYCRKTLRNARTDIIRKQAREARWETVFSDMHESELNRLASPDDLISEDIEEAARYFRIGEGKLRRLASELPTPDWVVMNGNRVQVKRKAFERFIDSTDVI